MTSKSPGLAIARPFAWSGALVAIACSLACSGTKPPPSTNDAGPPACPADPCHISASGDLSAVMTPACTLPVDGGLEACLNPSGDREWFTLPLPATLPDRPLLTVTTGMVSAPSSPVTLSVNVFQILDGGLSSMALASDPEPRGQPSNFAITIPLTGVSGNLYFLVDDSPGDNSGGMAFDNRHHFAISASITSDPDTAGHNPSTATAISLDGNNTGTATGVLSTTGDVDYFTVTVPQMARPILYVGVDAPLLTPAPENAIQFTVYNLAVDGGPPLGGGTTPNPELEQKAATAILLSGPGTYTVIVKAYQPDPTSPTPVGNPNYTYTVTAIVISDLDANEPNDSASEATPVSLTTQGQTTSLDGRIAYIPDPDWFAVTVPASAQNTVLKYQVSYDNSAPNNGRYPAMDFSSEGGPNVNTLQLTVGTLAVSLSSDGGIQSAEDVCLATCPGDTTHVQAGCTGSTPQCNFSLRIEDFTDYTNLDNFLGVIPVPASTTPTVYYVLLEVKEQNASDDRAYTMSFTWDADTSEASGYQDTLNSAPSLSMAVNGSYAQQPSGTPAMSGQLAYGLLGRSGDGSMAPNTASLLPWWVQDYDAVNDTDLWHLTLPNYNYVNPADGGLGPNGLADGGCKAESAFMDGGCGVPDLSWSLAWTDPAAPSQTMAGERPYDLFITFFLCDPASNPTCDPVAGTWSVASLGFNSQAIESWYGDSPPQPGYAYDGTSSFVANASQCLCLESRFVSGGQIYMAVSGVDRTSYDTSTYSVTTSAAPYPQSYSNGDGGPSVCPNRCRECEGDNNGCPTVQGIPTVVIP